MAVCKYNAVLGEEPYITFMSKASVTVNCKGFQRFFCILFFLDYAAKTEYDEVLLLVVVYC